MILWNGNECGKNYAKENIKATVPSRVYGKSKTTRNPGLQRQKQHSTRRKFFSPAN
jgi:hypothetical protein